ncbi:MAG: peptide-N-glycosidase F-related protein [Candidatus Zixiibacteriota bacterium]
MKCLRLILLVTIVSINLFSISSAATGDLHKIKSHDNVFVITDPSKGYNDYSNKTVFPSDVMEYRKVVINVTYACPDSLHCGEWDYIDNVYLRQINNKGKDTLDMELARLISPYGWWFDSDWSFGWNIDLTDFSHLLHDTVEVIFRHGGYEKNDDRGWDVTIEFELTEGKPSMPFLSMDTLWCGSFKYGDTADPIEKRLSPVILNSDSAKMARLVICQTGHGMDDYENCAEFCEKYRMIYFDKKLVDFKEIWKKCGDNALYPQAGTWIFDRSNWCPGDIVDPDIYTFKLNPDTIHELNIDMEPYINPNNPTANYAISSYIFYYGEPWAGNDVSIEKIIIPSDHDESSRINPSCRNPKILIKNQGHEPLTSLNINYGIVDSEIMTYKWRGNLSSQETEEIILPGPIVLGAWENIFEVKLESPNGVVDEYPYDNSMISDAVYSQQFNNKFILAIRTNRQPEENAYRLIDKDGMIIGGREMGTLMPETAYYDTFDLSEDCYQFLFVDTGGDGLEFWFNPDAGYGSVRILDMDGRLLKNFNSNFGSNINFVFTATENPEPFEIDSLPLVQVFPSRGEGRLSLFIFFNETSQVRVEIVHDSSKAIVFEKDYTDIKDDVIPIDIRDKDEGIYNINIVSGERTVARRYRLIK